MKVVLRGKFMELTANIKKKQPTLRRAHTCNLLHTCSRKTEEITPKRSRWWEITQLKSKVKQENKNKNININETELV